MIRMLTEMIEIMATWALLGAAFGGVPAFTATSCPGLALMSESIGLAIASETPVCIFNVQRGGPSTGLPTMVGQADVMQARWGHHGEGSIIALSPASV